MLQARKDNRLKERVEAHLKTLKIPKEIENEARQMVQNMLFHECFGNFK